MTRAEFVDFVLATFNAMDMITPAEGATAVVKAFDEYETALRACADALAPPEPGQCVYCRGPFGACECSPLPAPPRADALDAPPTHRHEFPHHGPNAVCVCGVRQYDYVVARAAALDVAPSTTPTMCPDCHHPAYAHDSTYRDGRYCCVPQCACKRSFLTLAADGGAASPHEKKGAQAKVPTQETP